jgi:peptidoglycan/LPS O-acetylase OafA/YrhL
MFEKCVTYSLVECHHSRIFFAEYFLSPDELCGITYASARRRLNLAVLLGSFGTACLVLCTYAFAENMGSPWLLLVMTLALAPVFPPAVKGLQAQGVATSEFVNEKLPKDARELLEGTLLSCTARVV